MDEDIKELDKFIIDVPEDGNSEEQEEQETEEADAGENKKKPDTNLSKELRAEFIQLTTMVENMVDIVNNIQSAISFEIVDKYGKTGATSKRYGEFRYDQKSRIRRGEYVQYADNEERFHERFSDAKHELDIANIKLFHYASDLNGILQKNGIELQVNEAGKQ